MSVILTSLFKRHSSLHILLIGVLSLTAQSFGVAHAQDAAPRLSSDTDIATAGFYRLSWEMDNAGRVELEQADNPTFTDAVLRYRGPDRASVISGMPNGEWYYRVRTVGKLGAGPWSKSVAVTVTHHPLARALMFFALGVVVFLATVVLILRGAEPAR